MIDQLMAMLQGGMDPALGATMANNPEVIAQHLASQGVPPPPLQPSPAMGGVPELISPLDPAPMPQARPRLEASSYAAGGDPGMDNIGGGVQQPQLRTFLNPGTVGAPPPVASSMPQYGPTPDQLYGAPADNPLDVVAPQAGNVPMPQARPSSTHFAGAGAPREGTPGAAQAAEPNKVQDLLKAMQGIKAPAAPTPQKVSTPSPMRPNQLPANRDLVQLLAAAMGGGAADVKPLFLSNLLGAGRAVR